MCTTSSELEKVLRRREGGLRSREVQKKSKILAGVSSSRSQMKADELSKPWFQSGFWARPMGWWSNQGMQPKLKVYKYYLLVRKRKKRGLAAVFKTRDPAGEPNSKIQYFKPLCYCTFRYESQNLADLEPKTRFLELRSRISRLVIAEFQIPGQIHG